MGERRKGHCPDELRERAVRMVQDLSGEHSSQWGAITSIAQKLRISSGETLRKWVREAEAAATKSGRKQAPVEDSPEVKRLRREKAEPKRASEIRKAAAGFFAAELSRPRRY
ncbi:hypothetical protein [Kineosporia babensis]|uniref:Transposase n=1 Tax=Kineosporia babensis TaxID=499548 RepID=A0A9X1STH3_9ACTN|nr:hypothetical protein [Kineosporia babensis]MCD5311817.1 hypothetical protein [Kineosporia babensis]